MLLLQPLWWYVSYLLWSAVLVALPAFVATSAAAYPSGTPLPLQLVDRYVAGVSKILFLVSCAFSALQTLIREHTGIVAADETQGAQVPPEVATPALRTAITLVKRASRALFAEFCAPRPGANAAGGELAPAAGAAALPGNPLALLGTLMSVASAGPSMMVAPQATVPSLSAASATAGSARTSTEEDWYGAAQDGAPVVIDSGTKSPGKNNSAAVPFARATPTGTRRRAAAAAAAKMRAEKSAEANVRAAAEAASRQSPRSEGSSTPLQTAATRTSDAGNSSTRSSASGSDEDVPPMI